MSTISTISSGDRVRLTRAIERGAPGEWTTHHPGTEASVVAVVGTFGDDVFDRIFAEFAGIDAELGDLKLNLQFDDGSLAAASSREVELVPAEVTA